MTEDMSSVITNIFRIVMVGNDYVIAVSRDLFSLVPPIIGKRLIGILKGKKTSTSNFFTVTDKRI